MTHFSCPQTVTHPSNNPADIKQLRVTTKLNQQMVQLMSQKRTKCAMKIGNYYVLWRGHMMQILTLKSANKESIVGTLQNTTKQAMTAIIVFKTFISVRDSLPPAAVPLAWCCCWTCPMFGSRDVVAMGTSWLRPTVPLTTLLWRLMVWNIRP